MAAILSTIAVVLVFLSACAGEIFVFEDIISRSRFTRSKRVVIFIMIAISVILMLIAWRISE